MTMPRELWCRRTYNNKRFSVVENVCPKNNYTPHVEKRVPYYSQAVLDEKDARIKQLEKLLKDIDEGLSPNSIYGSYYKDKIKEALAGKGGA